MRSRNWVGVALIFLFLPVNVPLWDMAFEVLNVDIVAVFITPLLFLLGILLVFFPSRKDRAISTQSNQPNEEE